MGGITIIQNAGVSFLFPRRGRVHNSCKRLSSARAARSPAFHAGVTCKSLHRNWGTCRHGRQRGTSRADASRKKDPVLIEAKQPRSPERDGTLSRVSTDLARSISSTFFAYVKTLRDRLFTFMSAGSESTVPCIYDYSYIHIHILYARLNLRVS